MRYHFMLDGLTQEQRDTLLSIEAAMPDGRSRLALFNLKALDVFTNRDPEKAKEFVSGKLGAFHMAALEALTAATGPDLLNLYTAVKNIPVTLKARPQQ